MRDFHPGGGKRIVAQGRRPRAKIKSGKKLQKKRRDGNPEKGLLVFGEKKGPAGARYEKEEGATDGAERKHDLTGETKNCGTRGKVLPGKKKNVKRSKGGDP